MGADLSQEELLPWWWENYRKWNDHPITWVDLGLSEKMRAWCQEKGELVRLCVASEVFVATRDDLSKERLALWDKLFGKGFWPYRSGWFKKPFTLLLAPYQKTLWIDCDCEVLGAVTPLFSLLGSEGISMRQDPLHIPPGFMYNSGVMAYTWGHRALELCADQVVDRTHEFLSDDHLLTHLLLEGNWAVQELPARYNYSWKEEGKDGIIVHWQGEMGKKALQWRKNIALVNEYLSSI